MPMVAAIERITLVDLRIAVPKPAFKISLHGFPQKKKDKPVSLPLNKRKGQTKRPVPVPKLPLGFLALGGSLRHHRRNLREDGADAGRNARHDCTGRDRDEASHQSVLNEILTFCIFPNLQLQHEIFHIQSPLPILNRDVLHR
jgi:hypothetical protein